MTSPGGLDTTWGWIICLEWAEYRAIRLVQTTSSTTLRPIPMVAPGTVQVGMVTPNAITQETRLPCQPSFRDGLPDLLRVCPPCRHGRTRQGGPVCSGSPIFGTLWAHPEWKSTEQSLRLVDHKRLRRSEEHTSELQ